VSWPVVKVGDVCSLMTGGTPKTSVNEFYDNGTVPWIVSGDVHKQEIFDCDKRITKHAVENSNARYLPKDSVLIALNGQGKTRGTVALLRINGATCNQSIVSLNPKDKDELFSDYLFYYLKSQYQNIRNITGDKDRAGLNMPLIRQIEIPLPPLSEQKRIAAILDKADAIRRKRQQAIQLADDFLRAVFLDMFGDPVTNPKGWEVRPLGELASKIGSGATPKGGKEAYHSEGISLIRSLNVHDDKFLHKDLAFIDEWQANALSNVEVKVGDVLLNITGASVCRAAMVDESILPARVNQHVCIIRSKDLVPQYVLHTILSRSFKRNLLNLAGAGGATREALTKAQIEGLLIPIAPKPLQQKFAKIKNIIRNANKKSLLASDVPMFKSLSQKAFSGAL